MSELPPVDDVATRVLSRSDERTVMQVRQARLEVVEGPDQGKALQIPEGGCVVGGDPAAELRLSDPAISRRHCEISVEERGFVLRDLGSRNGTRVAGLQVREVVLGPDHEIELGESRLRFSLLQTHDEFPLSDRSSFGALLGRSVAMRRIFALLERAAPSETTLLLDGESGTGKDVAAESAHQLSARRDGPFVVVDCGAVQSSLVEGELFGHAKGAFTGAEQERAGAFEAAGGGTVFLDEVGELDLGLQPRLLRLLEKREIRRLGESSYRPVDVRVIAATNRNLELEVAEGRFREDLYYRLSVVRVALPPLRARREDIGLLARAFVQKLRPDADPVEVISEPVLAMLLNHDWPGNVRELRNVVERLLLFPDYPQAALGASVEAAAEHDLGGLMGQPFHEARRLYTERFEKSYLSTLLDACGGVVTEAAKTADISRQTFHRLMTKHRLVK